MRTDSNNRFNIPIIARWVPPSVFVSVNGRTEVAAATLADSSPESFDVGMEPDGAIILTYQLSGASPVQRKSTDGGRTWA